MNIRGIFLILLFASATPLIFSMASQNTDVPVIPDGEHIILFKVNNPNLEFSVDTDSIISLNISYYDSETNSSKLIINNHEFQKEYQLEGLSSGLYSISIISSKLGTVTIVNNGFRLSSLLIFLIFVIINIYNLYEILEES